ncbi:hypothetical protein QTP88_018743 [Uroleucon formosanum]
MSGRGLKRKIDSECRVFNEKWSLDYFVIYSGDKIICLICKESISVLKEYNIRRHYETKHKTTFSKFTEKLRLDKLQSLQNNFSSQQLLFKKQKNINEAATKASFRISHLLAKRGKAFSDGSLIKECIIQAVEEICPERIDTFKNISLSANTVTRRIDDISNNLNSQVSNKTQEFISFSIALDESTDVSDTSQLLLFIRGVNKDLGISNELLSVHSMHGTTTGIDIFKVIEKSFLEYNLKWENLKCITTDGGRNMCSTKKGLIGQIFTNCEKEDFKPMTLHCIIHQQALCGKTLDLSCVMDPIISTVNFIRLSALRHRQFQDFLKEIETEYPDIPYFTAVDGLVAEKSYRDFLNLALDESTDIQDKPQLAIFVRYVTKDVDMKEELLDLISLKETTRGVDIKIAFDETLQRAEIPLNNIMSISTDGAPSIMVGCKNGLVGLLKNDTNFPDFIPIHCIIHRVIENT